MMNGSAAAICSETSFFFTLGGRLEIFVLLPTRFPTVAWLGVVGSVVFGVPAPDRLVPVGATAKRTSRKKKHTNFFWWSIGKKNPDTHNHSDTKMSYYYYDAADVKGGGGGGGGGGG